MTDKKPEFIPVTERHFTWDELTKQPNTDNWTPEMWADAYGAINEIHNATKTLRGFLQAGVKARMQQGYLQGKEYHQTLGQQNRSSLSVELVREKYPDVAEECTVNSAVEMVTSKRFIKS